jgi:hypothetical protein
MDIANAMRDIALASENGDRDRVEAYAELYKLKAVLEDCLSSAKAGAINDVAKYGKEGVVVGDLKLTIKSGAGRWNYQGVKQWMDLKTKMIGVEELAKAANKTGGFVTDENGEVINPAVQTFDADTIVATKVR